MSIEEKAKAYDEALERARKQRADYQKELDKTDKNSQLAGLLRAGISAIDMAFPELAESEDERIRKEILSYFNSEDIANQYVTEERRKRWTAWLEKQKDLFESGKGMYYYDGEKTTYCGYPATEENPYDFAMNQQEKQQEQKPVEWSEEDEKMLSDLRNTLGCLMNAGAITFKTKKKFSNWLKSIRPQPHWKPSEEQMKALKWWSELPSCSPGLKSLCEDLEKL